MAPGRPQPGEELPKVTIACTALTFLEKEALVRQLQGLVIHVDLDGRLLVLIRLEQPEGLVHKQVFQAVMSEAWSRQPWLPVGSRPAAGKP